MDCTMIELYTITFPDSTVYRYTSAVQAVVHDSQTYVARSGLVRGEIDVSITEMDSIMTMLMPCTEPAVRKYMESPPALPVAVVLDQIVDGDLRPWYRGIISSVAVSGITAEFRLVGDGVPQLSQATSLRYQSLCRHALYGTACGVDKTDHDVSGNLTAIEDNGLVLTSTVFGAPLDKLWIGGAIEIAGELRTIIAQPGADKIRIDRPIPSATSTSPFIAYKGCDKTVGTCRDKFANLANFGGIPTLPGKNPFSSPVNQTHDLPSGL
jgi:uncharacterized phage protein (TIGR02218 family)